MFHLGASVLLPPNRKEKACYRSINWNSRDECLPRGKNRPAESLFKATLRVRFSFPPVGLAVPIRRNGGFLIRNDQPSDARGHGQS